jgi:hypothetical protein
MTRRNHLIDKFQGIVNRLNRVERPHTVPLRFAGGPADADEERFLSFLAAEEHGEYTQERGLLVRGDAEIEVSIVSGCGGELEVPDSATLMVRIQESPEYPLDDARKVFNLFLSLAENVVLVLKGVSDSFARRLFVVGVRSTIALDEAGPKTLAKVVSDLLVSAMAVRGYLIDDQGDDHWAAWAEDEE